MSDHQIRQARQTGMQAAAGWRKAILENRMDGIAIKAMMAEIAPVIREFVSATTAPLVERIAELEQRPTEPDNVVILRLVEQEVAKIPAPENGKDADPEAVASLVAEQVERAVAALPAPQDGKSVGIEDVAPLIAEEVGKAVASLPVPRSVKGVIVNREGEAIYTYSDGSTENIGPVVGKDGLNGKDGCDAALIEPEPALSEDEQIALATMFLAREIGEGPIVELPALTPVRPTSVPKAAPTTPPVINVHLPEQHHAAPHVTVNADIKSGKVTKTVQRDDRGLVESMTEEES